MKTTFKIKFTKLLVFIAIPFLYFDARIFFGLFLGGANGEVVGIIYFILFITLGVMGAAHLKLKISTPFKILTLFFLFTFLRYLFTEVSIGVIVQQIIAYPVVIILSLYANQHKFWDYIIIALGIVILLDFVVIIDPINFFQARIAELTSLSSQIRFSHLNYNTIRHFGIHPAPGHLALISLTGFAVFFNLSRKFNHIVYFGISFIALYNGLMTFNRSFVLGLIVVLILSFFLIKRLSKIDVILILLLALAISWGVSELMTSNLYIRFSNRFKEDVIMRDWDTRFSDISGIEKTWNVVTHKPIFGGASRSRFGDSVVAKYGNTEILPHNGLLNVFATRGILYGTIFSSLFFWIGYKLLLGCCKNIENNIVLSVFTGLFIISLFDSFWETSVSLLIITYTLIFLNKTTKHGDRKIIL